MTIGLFVKRFCNIHCIQVKTFMRDTKFRVYPLNTRRSMTIATYFRVAEYMSEHSVLPIEFYLKRIKDVLEGNYICRD